MIVYNHKPVYLFVVTLLALSCTRNSTAHKSIDGLKGYVRKITEAEYEPKKSGGKTQLDLAIVQIDSFDYTGNLIKESIAYTNDASANHTYLFHQDPNGKTTGGVGYTASGAVLARIYCKNNRTNYVTETESYFADSSTEKTVYHYDEKYFTQQIDIYFNDSLSSKITFEYENDTLKAGNIYKLTDSSNIRSRIFCNEFDKQGNWTRQIHVAGDTVWKVLERKVEYY